MRKTGFDVIEANLETIERENKRLAKGGKPTMSYAKLAKLDKAKLKDIKSPCCKASVSIDRSERNAFCVNCYNVVAERKL